MKEPEQDLDVKEEQAGALPALFRALELVNASLELNSVLDELAEAARDIVSSEAAGVLLLEGGRLRFAAVSGRKGGGEKQASPAKGEGVAGWVVANNRPLCICDVAGDRRFSAQADRVSGYVTRSVLAVPLVFENGIIGVVEAVNKKDGRFNDGDLRLLSALASSAAGAIHRARLYGDLDELFFGTIKAFANTIESKDVYARGHSERIREYSLVIAREMALDDADRRYLEIAALLHDTGKIGVPEAVILKQGQLTNDEYRELKKHPVIGAEMFASVNQIAPAIPGIRHHQERYDGKGYPDGLAGTSIPLFGRIIAVANTFDAMTSDRPYRKALPDHVALDELKKFAGVQFDRACVAAFVQGYVKGHIKSDVMRRSLRFAPLCVRPSV